MGHLRAAGVMASAIALPTFGRAAVATSYSTAHGWSLSVSLNFNSSVFFLLFFYFMELIHSCRENCMCFLQFHYDPFQHRICGLHHYLSVRWTRWSLLYSYNPYMDCLHFLKNAYREEIQHQSVRRIWGVLDCILLLLLFFVSE